MNKKNYTKPVEPRRTGNNLCIYSLTSINFSHAVKTVRSSSIMSSHLTELSSSTCTQTSTAIISFNILPLIFHVLSPVHCISPFLSLSGQVVILSHQIMQWSTCKFTLSCHFVRHLRLVSNITMIIVSACQINQ